MDINFWEGKQGETVYIVDALGMSSWKISNVRYERMNGKESITLHTEGETETGSKILKDLIVDKDVIFMNRQYAVNFYVAKEKTRLNYIIDKAKQDIIDLENKYKCI